ncbi:MAG TPA: hypothetical protein VFS43_22925 [Polyangiaceae bacterium]|nr:hypothetical protein [Polyangiaceae bacterium]
MPVDEFYRAPRRERAERAALLSAFGRAYVELTGGPVTTVGGYNTVTLVGAQAGHELADDRETPEDDEACWCWNLTGNKRPPGGGVPWTTLATHEVVPNDRATHYIGLGLATREKFPHKTKPGCRAVYFLNVGPERSHPATHFRAFDSLDDGARFSLGRYFERGARYATDAIRRALASGDARAFALELKRGGYYSAEFEEYAAGLERELAKARAAAARVDWAALPLLSAAREKKVNDDAAAALWGSVRASQQQSLADLERSRREREGDEGDV